MVLVLVLARLVYVSLYLDCQSCRRRREEAAVTVTGSPRTHDFGSRRDRGGSGAVSLLPHYLY